MKYDIPLRQNKYILSTYIFIVQLPMYFSEFGMVHFIQMQFKILKERLAERFKSALSEFEAVQCKVYDKENELMKLMKSSESTTILPPPSGSNHLNGLILIKFND